MPHEQKRPPKPPAANNAEDTAAYSPSTAADATAAFGGSGPAPAAHTLPTVRPVTSADLVKILIEGGFLRPVHQEKLRRDLQHRFPDASQLAAELVRWGWLTEYQARMIQQGKAGELQFASYVLLEPVGKGGMGEVYKAQHKLLGRIAALKMVRGDWLADRDTVRRFLREAKIVAGLSHPNIVGAYEASEVNGVLFLAMEYVEGVDLRRLLMQKGRLPAAAACDYVRQAAIGLQYGHERGLVHRDIKPGNLMLATGTNVVKILDLGLARLDNDKGDERGQARTRIGTIMGTPDYLSPEQAVDTHRADIRSDIYSLGCTLYHLLADQPPFPGGTLETKLAAHLKEEPRPLEELCPDLPEGLGDVVRKMMKKKAAERFQTPGDVATALSRFSGGSAPAPQAAAPTTLGTPSTGSALTEALTPPAIPGIAPEIPPAIPMGPTGPQPELWTLPSISLQNPDASPERSKNSNRRFLWLALGGGGGVVVLFLAWMFMSGKGGHAEALPPGPLGELQAEKIPKELRPPNAPNELVAVLPRPATGKYPGVYKIGFSAGDHSLWAGLEDDLVQWDIRTGKVVKKLKQRHASYGMEVSTDGTRLAHGKGTLIDTENGAVLKSGLFDGDDVAISRDGRFLLFGVRGKGTWLYDSLTDAWEKDYKEIATHVVRAIAFSPDNKKFLCGGEGGIQVFDLATKQQLQRYSRKGYCTELTFLPSGTEFVSGHDFGVIDRWDLAQPKEPVQTYQGHKERVVCIRITPDGKTMVSVGGDVIVWDLVTGNKRHQWLFGEGSHDAALSHDGRHVAVGNKDGTICILRLPASASR